MNTFKIYFKETTVLEIGGTKRTFAANTMYGFKFISDKDLKNIRKQLIGKSTVDFQITENLLGCYQVIYGNKKPKDISTENLVTLNKGKKNKNKVKYATKSSIEEQLIKEENIEDTVPPVEEEVTIVSENVEGSEGIENENE